MGCGNCWQFLRRICNCWEFLGVESSGTKCRGPPRPQHSSGSNCDNKHQTSDVASRQEAKQTSLPLAVPFPSFLNPPMRSWVPPTNPSILAGIIHASAGHPRLGWQYFQWIALHGPFNQTLSEPTVYTTPGLFYPKPASIRNPDRSGTNLPLDRDECKVDAGCRDPKRPTFGAARESGRSALNPSTQMKLGAAVIIILHVTRLD